LAQTILSTTSTALQTYTVPSDWNDASNTIEGIGPGGSGSVRQSASIGGNGGGGGSYAKRTNVDLTAGSTVYYMLPAGGSAVDAWFNDLNRALQTDNNIGNGAPWSPEGGFSAPVQGQLDPTGGSRATKFTENTNADDLHGVYQQITKPASVATPITLLFWIKPFGTTRFGEVVLYDDGAGTGLYASVNLTAGTGVIDSTGTGWTATSVTVTADGNGYFKVKLSGTINASRNYVPPDHPPYLNQRVGNGDLYRQHVIRLLTSMDTTSLTALRTRVHSDHHHRSLLHPVQGWHDSHDRHSRRRAGWLNRRHDVPGRERVQIHHSYGRRRRRRGRP
jgi:hypothetical protein